MYTYFMTKIYDWARKKCEHGRYLKHFAFSCTIFVTKLPSIH